VKTIAARIGLTLTKEMTNVRFYIQGDVNFFPEIGDNHSSEEEDSCLLGCNAV
jgi:hypothetical protein